MLRRNFRIALTYAGLTQKAWAKELGVAPAVVAMVISGKNTSARITAHAEAFIAEQLPKLRKELNESLTE